MIKTEDIRIRDPFVLAVEEEQAYYLFGTTDENVWEGKGTGFDVYKSSDLINWEGPSAAFRPGKDFWADENFWAPEVHFYKGTYYMLASFKKKGMPRGTQILSSRRPEGPYLPYTEGVLTPEGWECLDGTLHIGKDGEPWLIFSREWTQVGDGEIHGVRLSEDLRARKGEPVLLFKASQTPWAENVAPDKEAGGIRYVTDGPFLYVEEDSSLKLMWSSFYGGEYAMGSAESSSGDVTGPWIHEESPFYHKDGGHGMIFRAFDGRRILAIHAPNVRHMERPRFICIENGTQAEE